MPRRLAIVSLLLLLGGCATAPVPRQPTPDWNTVKLERQGWANWALSGRAAVTAASEGWSAALDWRQSGPGSELRLSGPFGIGALRVSIEGGQVRIETGRGEALAGEDARLMLEHTLGVALPLQSLRYWLLGVPEPWLPALAQLDDQGRLARLDQGGWGVTYEDYDYNPAQRQWLPARVSAEQGAVKLRVVVDRWRLDD